LHLQLLEIIDIVQFHVPKRLPGTLFLRNLVERRSLLFQLVRRDFEQRFVGSAIGWVWGLIQPLALLVSWIFLFKYVLKQDVSGLDIFAKMLPWMLFSATVQRSASSLLDHSNLITKTVFPAEIVPVSVFLSELSNHVLALALMMASLVIGANKISVFLILLPAYVLVIGLLGVGLGWIASSLHVYLRDTAQAVNVVFIFWFWFTPIFYEEASFPNHPLARLFLYANPLTYMVRAYRSILIEGKPPAIGDFGIALAMGAVVFTAGGLFFRYMKRGFADVL
jgi:lipopolysaccharide transport system permease protein